MFGGSGRIEPATLCLEDRRSDSTELQTRKDSPKSQVQRPMSVSCLLTLDLGHWTFDEGWRSELESNQPLGFFKPTLIRLSYPTEIGS